MTNTVTTRKAREGEVCTAWNAWDGDCNAPAVLVSEGKWNHENWKTCERHGALSAALRRIAASRKGA